jgi:putative spermidine/putrescine transport system substrate-binding protein
MTFTQSPAPELPAKIKAQQNANRVEIDLVLTGTDALAAGIEQGLWTELLPAHANDLPALDAIYLPAAAKTE